VAFLFGWLSMLVTDPGITAAVAVGLATYVSYLFPLSSWGRGAVAVGAIAVLAAVNMRGVRFSSGVIRGLAALKLGVLGFLVLWGLGLGRGDWSNFVPLVAQRPGSKPLVDALIGGMIAAFFSLGGWWDVSKIVGEVRDPRRTLPRALLLGVILVTVVYVLINLDPRLARAFLLTIGRPPDGQERDVARRFLQTPPARYSELAPDDARHRAWADFCQMILASNSFLYVE